MVGLFFILFLALMGLILFNSYLKTVSPEIIYIDDVNKPKCQVTTRKIYLNIADKPNFIKVLGEAYYHWTESRSISYWLLSSMSHAVDSQHAINGKLVGVSCYFGFVQHFSAQQLFVYEHLTSQKAHIERAYGDLCHLNIISENYSADDFYKIYLTKINQYTLRNNSQIYQFLKQYSRNYVELIGKRVYEKYVKSEDNAIT